MVHRFSFYRKCPRQGVADGYGSRNIGTDLGVAMSDDLKPANAFETLAARARDDAKRYLDSADKLRSRADGFANGAKALGLAAVGWVGFSSLTDVFPWRGGEGLALTVLSVILMLAMAGSALMLGFHLSKQARPLVTSADIAAMRQKKNVSSAEADTIAAIYQAFTDTNRVDSPADNDAQARATKAMKSFINRAVLLELRAEEYYDPDRVQPDLPDGLTKLPPIELTDTDREAKILLGMSRAAQIRAEVFATQARVATILIRERVVSATIGPLSKVGIGLFAVSLVALWYVSDLSRANQAEPTTSASFAKACAEAVDAVAKSSAEPEIPGECKRDTGTPPAEPESKSAIIVSVASLSKALSDCRANGPSADQLNVCISIETELEAELAALNALPPK